MLSTPTPDNAKLAMQSKKSAKAGMKAHISRAASTPDTMPEEKNSESDQQMQSNTW